MKTLFKNCYVLSGHDISFTSLIVDGDRIAYIGDEPESCDSFRDMHGALLMPGLVNAHAHGPMTLLRGAGSGLDLQHWLHDAIFPIEEKLSFEDVRRGEEWAIIEMLAGGTTMAAEMYDFPYATAEALLESGMKATVCRVGLAFSESAELPAGRLGECIEIVKNFKDKSGKVVADFCLHSEYLTNESFVRSIAEANRELKRSVHVHVSETALEHNECYERHGLSPIAYFSKLGLLDQNTYAAHCVWCDEKDIRIMKEKGVSVVHNPSSNLKLGSGFAPVKRFLELGINVALGTDGTASNNNLNMFEEMHIASLIHNGKNRDPLALLPEDIIDMATLNGARALGFSDTGILEVGKKADITAVSLDGAHLYPALDLLPLICYSMQASDVVMTMVDGRILYDHGEYTSIDVDRARFELEGSIRRLY